MEVSKQRVLAKELPKPFTARFTPDEFKYFRLSVHPTRRAEAKEVTKRIILYLNEREMATNLEIQQDLGLAETTVLKRLNVFMAFKLLKREFNRYYVVTPRLRELVKLYLGHL